MTVRVPGRWPDLERCPVGVGLALVKVETCQKSERSTPNYRAEICLLSIRPPEPGTTINE